MQIYANRFVLARRKLCCRRKRIKHWSCDRLSRCEWGDFQYVHTEKRDTQNLCALFDHDFDHVILSDWDRADAITMLRNPVDRVWSMYRFQTKECYRCRNLTDVYNDIDRNSVHSSAYSGVCLPQLVNHLTTNLLTNASSNMSESDQLANAVDNLRTRFAVVGLLEQHNTSVAMFEHVFPWLAASVSTSEARCNFPHANGSPQNNHCGVNSTHW